MQWTMSSYSLDLISLSFLGLCSDTIWAAVSLTYLRRDHHHDQIINIGNLHLPVELLYLLVGGEGVLGHLARLHHQDGSSEVPPAPLGDPGGELLGQDAALLLGHGGDDVGHLVQAGGRHPHCQASGPGIDDHKIGHCTIGSQADNTRMFF